MGQKNAKEQKVEVEGLQGLEQYQINMVFNWCEMSGIQDVNRARNSLEACGWHLESAVNEMIGQMTPAQRRQQEQQNRQREEIERVERQQAIRNAQVRAQQDEEYLKVQEQMTKQQKQQENTKAKLSYKEEILLECQKEFQNRVVEGEPFTIKFRLPNKVAQYTFSQNDTVQVVFKYVSFCLRDGFEQRFGKFDLNQPITGVSLGDRREEILGKVFEGSIGEVLTLKELS